MANLMEFMDYSAWKKDADQTWLMNIVKRCHIMWWKKGDNVGSKTWQWYVLYPFRNPSNLQIESPVWKPCNGFSYGCFLQWLWQSYLWQVSPVVDHSRCQPAVQMQDKDLLCTWHTQIHSKAKKKEKILNLTNNVCLNTMKRKG